jgi:flagellar motor switch protein FliG
MERDKVAALRRVAIVLSSLPDATARRLLASLEPDHQRAVRATINHLDDVDPLERRRALDGFTHSMRNGRPSLAGENDAAEIVLSRVAIHRDDARLSDRSQAHSANDADSRSGNSSAFAFLSSVDDDAIAHRIKEEHPQTIAIVLAAISPRQAARLLAKLGVALRAETMRRLAKMDTPPPEVVEEIAAQLKLKLVHGNSVNSGAAALGTYSDADATIDKPRSAGQAALQAILAEMNHANGQPGIGNPAMESGYRNINAAYGGADYHATTRPSGPLSERAALGRESSPDNTYGAASTRHLRNSLESVAVPDHRAGVANTVEEKINRPAKSQAEIHSQLISTPPAKLREALASVDGRQAILALCGLPKATAEAVLNDLPRRQAKQIRQQIASFAMVELREIDAAKAAVAKAILPPENRSPAAAAASRMTSPSPTLAAA